MEKYYYSQIQDLPVEALASYIVLKKNVGNSVYYNYSINKVSKISKQNLQTTKKAIQEVLKHGLARIENGNLILISKHKMDGIDRKFRLKRGSFQITALKYKDVKRQIRKELIKNHFNKYTFVAQIASDLNYSKNIKSLKRAKTLSKKFNIKPSGEWNKRIRIGTKRIGEVIKCSQFHAWRLMKDFATDLGYKIIIGAVKPCFRQMYKKSERLIAISKSELHYREPNQYLNIILN